MLNLMKDNIVVRRVVEGSQFSLLNGNVVSPAYAGWTSAGYSLVEVQEELPTEVQPQSPTFDYQQAMRMDAYRNEADPLYFKWQAGEATETEWLAKRQEIRDRYPYPTE